MELYTYFRSSAAYRVRIALNLKGLKADDRCVHLLKDGGQQHKPEFKCLNPQGFVPALGDQGHILIQSMAIIEYLEETHPQPPLLPKDALGRARVRALSLIVAADIHPLQNNQRVMQYLATGVRQADAAVKKRWIQRWITDGFAALEKLLAGEPGHRQVLPRRYAHHGRYVLLVPQMFNARRFETDLTPFPTLRRIDEHCRTLKAFQDAAPDKQADFEA